MRRTTHGIVARASGGTLDRSRRCRLSYALRHERSRRRRPRILRPSAWALDALLHRDVGALQLLRHAGVPHPLHGGAGRRTAAWASRTPTPPRSTAPTPAASGARRFWAASSRIASSASTAACSSAASSSRSGTSRWRSRRCPSSTPASTLIVVGTGLLKPNVSTVVGSLYAPGDTRRDAGFSIFYMGINLGAFLGPFIAGYLAQRVDWHLGFACAGIGMAFGVTQYILGRKRLQPAVERLAAQPSATVAAHGRSCSRVCFTRRTRWASRASNGSASAPS